MEPQLISIKTCFLCIHGINLCNENGRNFANCSASIKDETIFDIHDERYLPMYCGMFEYRDKLCSVCSKELFKNTFFVVDKQGILRPVCSKVCANIIN